MIPKTHEEIDAQYRERSEFYADNSYCAYEEMIHYRKMVEDAVKHVKTQAMNPQANAWLEEYKRIREIEEE